MSRLRMKAVPMDWPMLEPFAISRGLQYSQPVLRVELEDEEGHRGRGEASGVDYKGETPETMLAQIEACRAEIEAGATRDDVQFLLPAGGARNALDCAHWDLEAQRSGQRVLAGVRFPMVTAYTIGIRSLESYEETARRFARFPLLKVKVDGEDPLPAVDAVRRGSPEARLIVDPNQAWTVAQLRELAAPMAARGVVLLEQPVAVGDGEGLRGWRSPVPLCADELVSTAGDVERAAGLFDVVNVKLDKAGGLTEALRVADAAERRGLGLMVGCMAGSSLAMAPALLVAARCTFIDLDGPLLHQGDVSPGLSYEDGWIAEPPEGLWG